MGFKMETGSILQSINPLFSYHHNVMIRKKWISGVPKMTNASFFTPETTFLWGYDAPKWSFPFWARDHLIKMRFGTRKNGLGPIFSTPKTRFGALFLGKKATFFSSLFYPKKDPPKRVLDPLFGTHFEPSLGAQNDPQKAPQNAPNRPKFAPLPRFWGPPIREGGEKSGISRLFATLPNPGTPQNRMGIRVFEGFRSPK